jgi:hypothetical protein
MASQRPGCDIPWLDYSTIVGVPRVEDESLPTKQLDNLLINSLGTANPTIAADADATINVHLAESTSTLNTPNTELTSFANSNIYDESDNDLPDTLATSILPSESALQVPPRVPQLQTKSRT